MKKSNKLKLILLLILIINVNKVLAQDFYKDFVKWQDTYTKPSDHLSETKLHTMHKQFASEFRTLFNEVKQNTGFDMLDCDTLYIFESQQSQYAGGYSKLVWNKKHSCWYQNPRFSSIYEYQKEPIKTEIDAQKKLLALGPDLKDVIQKTDTIGYKKYIASGEAFHLGAVLRFVVATKVGTRWYFFSSKSFATSQTN